MPTVRARDGAAYHAIMTIAPDVCAAHVRRVAAPVDLGALPDDARLPLVRGPEMIHVAPRLSLDAGGQSEAAGSPASRAATFASVPLRARAASRVRTRRMNGTTSSTAQ